jgi:hypothetical protein
MNVIQKRQALQGRSHIWNMARCLLLSIASPQLRDAGETLASLGLGCTKVHNASGG